MNKDDAYAFVTTTDKKYQTKDMEQQLLKHLLDSTENVAFLKGIIFIDKFPRTMTGKPSRGLMFSILNKQPHQIPILSQQDFDDAVRRVEEQVGTVNISPVFVE